MEANSVRHPLLIGRLPPLPVLKLASDERLVALTRQGQERAFETLVHRYRARLLAFCRHLLGSKDDAEDVLQEVFVSAYNALLADNRPINVRPWLYRIARNRCLNELRRNTPSAVESMDGFLADRGESVSERILQKERFQHLIADIGDLPESQRTALLLRELDDLSYDQIAEAMETTVPSVKSLLVRARVSLAEAAQARALSCDQVRITLGEEVEGLVKLDPAVRRHLRHCERCRTFRAQLKHDEQLLTALLPVGLLPFLQRLLLAHLPSSCTSAYLSGGGAAGTGALGSSAASAGSLGGLLSAGGGAVATKAAVGIATAALIAASAVATEQSVHRHPARAGAPRAGSERVDTGSGAFGAAAHPGAHYSQADKAQLKPLSHSHRAKVSAAHKRANGQKASGPTATSASHQTTTATTSASTTRSRTASSTFSTTTSHSKAPASETTSTKAATTTNAKARSATLLPPPAALAEGKATEGRPQRSHHTDHRGAARRAVTNRKKEQH